MSTTPLQPRRQESDEDYRPAPATIVIALILFAPLIAAAAHLVCSWALLGWHLFG